MNHTPVTAVVFDIGAVLVDWNPEYLYAKVIPDPDERRWFLSEICTPEWNFAMDAGTSVSEEVAKLAAEKPEYADLINPWWDRWREMLGDEIPGTREIAEELRRIRDADLRPYELERTDMGARPSGIPLPR